MASNRSRMTFEEFTQVAMSVIDRALEASRVSENQLLLKSYGNIGTPQLLPQGAGRFKKS